jgi:hypothetical protein
MSVAYFEDQRREMIAAIRVIAKHLVAEIGKTALDDRVVRAMAKVPRHEFVPIEVQPYAYLNRPLPIGFDKTISQPLMVAVMTDLLNLKPDDVVPRDWHGPGLSVRSDRRVGGQGVHGRTHRRTRATGSAAAQTRRLHQRCGSRRKRLFRLARARAVRQGDRYSGARPHSTSANQSAQVWRKDGDPGRTA